MRVVADMPASALWLVLLAHTSVASTGGLLIDLRAQSSWSVGRGDELYLCAWAAAVVVRHLRGKACLGALAVLARQRYCLLCSGDYSCYTHVNAWHLGHWSASCLPDLGGHPTAPSPGMTKEALGRGPHARLLQV